MTGWPASSSATRSSGSCATRRYQIYSKRDYANTKGFVLSVYKRPVGDIFSAQLAYTFQIAEGINSNPDDERAALLNNTEPARSLTPLNWDQKHQVNLSLGLTEPDWGAFLVGRYGSGFPYTPTANQAEATGGDVSVAIKNNSRRRPESLTFDIRAYKNFALGPVTLSAFLRAFNLFDKRNEVTVYGTTGRSTTTPEIEGLNNVTPRNGVNSVSELTIPAQLRRAIPRHGFGRMIGRDWAMATLAGNASCLPGTCLRVEAGHVTFEAVARLALFFPGPQERFRLSGIAMDACFPGGLEGWMASLAIQFRTATCRQALLHRWAGLGEGISHQH